MFDAYANAMRPHLADGCLRPRLDVLSTNDQCFIKDSAWNYGLAVPQGTCNGQQLTQPLLA